LEELKLICQKISKLKDVDDLLQSCVEQFLLNPRPNQLSDKERLYFFAKIVRNNYHSQTSPFYQEYGKYKFSELNQSDIKDPLYEEPEINLDWVRNIIKFHKMGSWWYYARLMELYLEEGCSITKLAKRTTIPKNSVSRDINKYRKELRRLREEHLRRN